MDRKGDGTPITEADRAAERLIRSHLAKHHPEDAILGEEEGMVEGRSDRRWFIDPIDGTRSFIYGIPEYATLLAIEDSYGMAVGVIEFPALGETIAAGRGLGCFWNDVQCDVSARTALDGAVLTRSDYRHTAPDMLARLDASPMQHVTWGDAFGYSLVATGRVEAMLDPIVHPWDIAPMAVIIPESGGKFTDLGGVENVHGGSGLATNGHLHDDVLAVVTGHG